MARMYLEGPVTKTGKKRYTRVCWNKSCPLYKQIIKKKTNARA